MGTVAWFGRQWDAPAFDEAPQVPVPFGAECLGCGELVDEDDAGVTMPYVTMEETVTRAFHLECHLRSMLGSVDHLEQRCSCFGGTGHDDFTRAGAQAVLQRLLVTGRGRWAD